MVTNHRPLWLLPLIVALVFSACKQDDGGQPVQVEPTGFVPYAHPTGVFSLSMPPEWIVSDLSDEYALNVSFSAPNQPDPSIDVYIVSRSALAETRPPDQPLTGPAITSPVETEMDPLISVYLASHYTIPGLTYNEINREIQVDGSLRVDYSLVTSQRVLSYNEFFQVIGPYFVSVRVLLSKDEDLLRTSDRIVNTLIVNATAEWASTLRATGLADLVEFMSLNHWMNSGGGFVIVGQVRNNATQPLEFVRINATLVDGTGRPVVERDDFIASDMLLPGEEAPFTIVFTGGMPPGVTRYDLEASARYAPSSEAFYGPENFTWTTETSFDENRLLVISGQVRNEGLRTATLVKVIVSIFDAEGRLVGTDTVLVDAQPLVPGEIAAYRVRFYELGGEPYTFEATVQGLTITPGSD